MVQAAWRRRALLLLGAVLIGVVGGSEDARAQQSARVRVAIGASYGVRLAGADVALRVRERVQLSIGPVLTAPHARAQVRVGVRLGVNVALAGTVGRGLFLGAETSALSRRGAPGGGQQGGQQARDPVLLGGILLGSGWSWHRLQASLAGGVLTPLEPGRVRLRVTLRLRVAVRF